MVANNMGKFSNSALMCTLNNATMCAISFKLIHLSRRSCFDQYMYFIIYPCIKMSHRMHVVENYSFTTMMW